MSMAWIPGLGITAVFGKIYFDSYSMIYHEIRSKYESQGYVLDGPDINKVVMHSAGGLVALSTLFLTHGSLYSALRKMMLTPTQNLRRQQQLLTQVMEATPAPLPLTPPRMWKMLGPSSNPHSVRRFWRLYGNLLFFHWLSFTLAVTVSATSQAVSEATLFGIHDDQHALTRRDRNRLQQAAAQAAMRRERIQGRAVQQMAELEGANSNPR